MPRQIRNFLSLFHTHASMVKEYTEPVLAACRKISRTLGYLGSPKARGSRRNVT